MKLTESYSMLNNLLITMGLNKSIESEYINASYITENGCGIERPIKEGTNRKRKLRKVNSR